MDLTVYRDYPEGPAPLGKLTRKNGTVIFRYSESYLGRDDAAAVSRPSKWV